MLPHDMQAPSCPAVLRRRPQQLVRPIFAGVVAGMMVGILVVAFGASRENTVIYRDLGAAKDLGIQPGDGVGAGFGRKGQPPANGAIDERVRLGHMYYGGYGVPQDDVRAARQFSLAAADGVAHGQAALGFFRENGIGVPQDFIKALNWYRKASEQGDSWARTRLALMYRDGRGVPRDMEHAFKLFKSAAQQGEVSAQYFLAEAYENGWGMAENAKEAIKWYGDAAAQGHAKAEYRLGILYSDGRSMPRNEAQAVSWFERSARQGYAPAQFAFGMAYELGLGVPLDPIRALLWYSLAEWHGHAGVTHRRDQYLRSLSEVERQAASLYRRRWLRENFLSDDLVGKFREYQKMRDPKAFAASMNGAWAISEGAGNQGDAARAALTRCRRLAQICLLYALGDQVVIGIDLREVNALIMSESRRAAR
jgi:TPR repeat protein